MADTKKPEDTKKADQNPALEATPRPDPVGERNYALGAPIVRPEGEGTPGAMRQSVASVPPIQAEPKPDEVVKAPEPAPDKVDRKVAVQPDVTKRERSPHKKT